MLPDCPPDYYCSWSAHPATTPFDPSFLLFVGIICVTLVVIGILMIIYGRGVNQRDR